MGSLQGSVVAGRYRVRTVLGRGGNAVVYEAEDTTFGRTVAIKVPLEPGADGVPAKRLVREARASGAIGHPNIVEVSEVGHLQDGTPFVVMERLVGETLRDRLTQEGRLGFGDLVDITMQVLSGLGAAHQLEIVHRDIKAENIFLVRRSGCPALVKILDFGNVPNEIVTGPTEPVRTPGHDAAPVYRADLTATGMVVGTPEYLAPEQLRGMRHFDARVDVYACGVVLYELVTGRLPFRGSNLAELCDQILRGTPPPVSTLRPETPPGLARIIERALAPRETRFGSAPEMQLALAEVRVEPPTPAPIAVPERTGPGVTVSIALPRSGTDSPVAGPELADSFSAPEEWEQQTDYDEVPDWDQPTVKNPLSAPRKSR